MVSAAIPLLLATAAIAGLQVASAAPVATDVLAKGTMECGGEPNESDLMTCTLNTNKKCADEEFGGPFVFVFAKIPMLFHFSMD
ncbi:hypothetical protein PG988_011467 [Apiospora saccharicola]